MALDMISNWWLFAIGIILMLAGRFLKDASIGTLGGILLFLQGVFILITGVSGLTNFMNLALGFVLFGVGSYVVLVGGTEALKAGGWWNF